MTKEELFQNILKKQSYLCVGLDSDIKKIPSHLLKEKDPLFEFNRQIIDATEKFAVAYKPNLAFYESLGARGWDSLQRTIEYIPSSVFTIADAKRGDIGNTSSLYARAFFEQMNFDSVTVSPYMGEDSVKPFIDFKNKWVILLALTSNEGSKDFQELKTENGEELYVEVIRRSKNWGSDLNIMYVVGATQTEKLVKIRNETPNHFLLVPGVGAQGGDLEEVSKNGMNKQCGLLVNSSRSIIYASSSIDFSERAGKVAGKIQKEMSKYLEKYL